MSAVWIVGWGELVRGGETAVSPATRGVMIGVGGRFKAAWVASSAGTVAAIIGVGGMVSAGRQALVNRALRSAVPNKTAARLIILLTMPFA